MVTKRRMTPRRSAGWLVLLAVVVGIAETRPRAVADASRTPTSGTAFLNLRLTVSSELPSVSQKALINESESIWRDAKVQLRWLAPDAGAETGRPLRVLITRRVITAISDHRWPVGELVRFEDSTAIAMASITAALQIVQEGPELPLLDLPAMRQYRLGVVLGRAVAHEIGHYLLETNAHASSGLMRASIDAREFADFRTGTFRLDRESQAYLAARATRND